MHADGGYEHLIVTIILYLTIVLTWCRQMHTRVFAMMQMSTIMTLY